MDLQRELEKLSGKDAFLTFLAQLSADYRENPQEWENQTIDSFLEAMAAWIADASAGGRGYLEWDRVDWAAMAKILYMGRLYE